MTTNPTATAGAAPAQHPATATPTNPATTPRPTNGTAATVTAARPATAPAPATSAPASRMSISNIRRGKVSASWRVLAYGPEGVGKTLFAASSDAPVYLCAESGTEQYDIPRLPEPQTWDDVFDAFRSLREDKHDRKTLVIDTLDWLEPLCWAHVCKKAGKESIEDFGYGKGHVAALDEWRRFLAALEALRRARGMWVVMLAHSQVKSFKNPEGADYDRYQLKLNEKAAGLIKEWCDAVLFATFDHCAYQKSEKDKAKGVGTVGARIVHTQRSPAFDAKNRFSLPLTIPLSWADFIANVDAGAAAVDPAKIQAEIDGLVAQLAGAPREVFDPAGFAKARADAGMDSATLARLVDRLRAKIGIAGVGTVAAAPGSTSPSPAPAA